MGWSFLILTGQNTNPEYNSGLSGLLNPTIISNIELEKWFVNNTCHKSHITSQSRLLPATELEISR